MTPVKLGPDAGRDHRDRQRASRPARWSWSTARTGCARARRSSSITRDAQAAPRGRARRRRRKRRAQGGASRRPKARERAQGRRLSAPSARRAAPMNPSRLFILRPVATTLLMVAILLVGHRRLPRAAAVGAAGGRLPDDPGGDALSRREPGRDDVVGHRAAGAPVRPDAGPEPDVVDELRRRLGHHAAVQPRAAARRRRAGGAGRDQRRGQLPAGRPAAAADLQQGQSGRRADPDARRSPRSTLPLPRDRRTSPTRGSRRRSRSCPASGWSASAAASGRRCASRPIPKALAAYGLSLEDVRTAIANANVNQAKGSFDGPTRASTIDANDQLQVGRRVPAS